MNISPILRLTVFFISILITTRTMATDCSVMMEYNEAVQETDEIFMGTLIKIVPVKYIKSETGPPTLFDSGWYDFELVFDVQKKWKGGNSNRISVFVDNICPPYFTLNGNKELSINPTKKEFIGYNFIIYAVRDASRLEEMIYRSSDLNSDNFDIPGFRIISGSYFRTLAIRDSLPDSLFTSEIAKLDSTFIKPVTLLPYFINFRNFFLMIFLGIGVLYIRKKFRNSHSV